MARNTKKKVLREIQLDFSSVEVKSKPAEPNQSKNSSQIIKPEIRLFAFPKDGNTRVKQIQSKTEQEFHQFYLNIAAEIFITAEKIIDIETALGERIRNNKQVALSPLSPLYTIISAWFRLEKADDLHPLFPMIVESMGFKDDDSRIRHLWQVFYHEKAKSVFENFPILVKPLLKACYFPERDKTRVNFIPPCKKLYLKIFNEFFQEKENK
jgi:hypothetical protein